MNDQSLLRMLADHGYTVAKLDCGFGPVAHAWTLTGPDGNHLFIGSEGQVATTQRAAIREGMRRIAEDDGPTDDAAEREIARLRDLPVVDPTVFKAQLVGFNGLHSAVRHLGRVCHYPPLPECGVCIENGRVVDRLREVIALIEGMPEPFNGAVDNCECGHPKADHFGWFAGPIDLGHCDHDVDGDYDGETMIRIAGCDCDGYAQLTMVDFLHGGTPDGPCVEEVTATYAREWYRNDDDVLTWRGINLEPTPAGEPA